MKKYKIVHYCLRGNLAGAQVVAFNIADNLKDKYEFSFIVGESEGNFIELLKKNNIKHYVVDTAWQIDLEKDFSTFKKLTAVFLKNQPDIIHLHSSKPAVLGGFSGKLAGIKTIFHVHGFPFYPGRINNIFYKFVNIALINTVDAVVVMNKEDKEFALTYLKDPYKCHYIENYVDLELFKYDEDKKKELREKYLKDKKDHFVILWQGRLAYYKNVNWLVRLMESLKKEKIIWLVIGQGPMYDYLRIKKREIPNLLLNQDFGKKFFTREEMVDFYQIADLNILFSDREGDALSILEGFAMKLPAVVNNVRGLKDRVLESKAGFVVENLIDAKKALLKIKKDSILRMKMKENAYTYVKNWADKDSFFEKIDILYESLILDKKLGFPKLAFKSNT